MVTGMFISSSSVINGDDIGVITATVDGTCLVPGSTLLELQHKKPTELKTEVVGVVEAKKEAQKEMETCFGFDVSVFWELTDC